MRAFDFFLSVCFTLRDYIFMHFFSSTVFFCHRVFSCVPVLLFYHVFFFVLLALSYRVLSDFWYSSTRMQVFLFFFVWKNRINSHIKSKSVRPYECYWPIQLRAYVNVHDTRSLLNK